MSKNLKRIAILVAVVLGFIISNFFGSALILITILCLIFSSWLINKFAPRKNKPFFSAYTIMTTQFLIIVVGLLTLARIDFNIYLLTDPAVFLILYILLLIKPNIFSTIVYLLFAAIQTSFYIFYLSTSSLIFDFNTLAESTILQIILYLASIAAVLYGFSRYQTIEKDKKNKLMY